MKKVKTPGKQYVLGLMTMVVLGLLFAFYFLFYVSKRDREITERNFSVLDRITVTINTRIEDHIHLGGTKITNHDFGSFINLDSIKNGKEKSLIDTIKLVDELGDSAYLKFIVQKDPPGEYYYTFHISTRSFLEPILRKDLFEHFLLIHDSSVIYNDLGQGIMTQDFDSLFEKKSLFKTNITREVKFSGKEYTLFITPFYLHGRNRCALAGIIASSDLNRQRYAVPQGFLFSVLFILLITFISFPFIKLLLMNASERLNTRDILSIFFAFFLGVGLIVFMILNMFVIRGPDPYRHDTELENLSDSIKQSFTNDLATCYKQLCVYDSLVDSNRCDIINLKTSCNRINCNLPQAKTTINPPFYPWFKLVNWLNENARDTIEWTTEPQRDNKSNYSGRDYYKKVRDNAVWKLPGLPDSSFVMQPLHSWTDNKFKATISKRSIQRFTKEDGVSTNFIVAISSRLPSVISPILPVGYSYCIIKQEGEVLFHSDINKNLNENFIEACSRNDKLRSAIYSRASVIFKQNYATEDCSMYISPISSLPLYLVTIREDDYMATAHLETFVFTGSVFFSNVLFIVILFFSLILISRNRTKLRSNFFQVEWLWPAGDKTLTYRHTVILNLFMLACSVILFTAFNPLATVLLIFINTFYSTSYYFYVSFVTRLKETDKESLYRFYTFFTFYLLFGLLLLNSSVFIYLGEDFNLQVCLVVYQLVLFATIFFLRLLPDPGPNPIVKPHAKPGILKQVMAALFKKNHYDRAYSRMLLSWCILSVFFPVSVLYKISYNHELKNLVKFNQLHIAGKINSLTDFGSPTHDANFAIVDTLGIKNVYTGIFHGSTVLTRDPDSSDFLHPEDLCNRSEEYFSYLVQGSKIVFNDVSILEDQLSNICDRDTGAYRWYLKNNDTLLLRCRDIRKSNGNIGDNLVISSKLPALAIFFPGDGNKNYRYPIFLIFLALFIFMLYRSIRFFVNKLFITDYFTVERIPSETNINIPNFPPVKRSMLIGLPNSGKTSFLRKNYGTYEIIDFNLIDDEVKWKDDCQKILLASPKKAGVIIKHFEFKLSDRNANDKKLQFIEKVIRVKDLPVIIVSTLHMEAFLENLKSDKMNTDISRLADEGNYFRWSTLISSFEEIYFPLARRLPIHEANGNIDSLIDSECNYGTFLPRFTEKLNNYVKEKPVNKLANDHEFHDEIILKIQHMAYPYYIAIWNSLTREEQYLLYDLAEDGLANHKSREILTLLCNKGLVNSKNKRPVIMNQSFKNFILIEVKSGSAVMDDRERSIGSTWNSFKTPFYVLMISVIAFLFYTQQETFSKLTAIIGTFTASLPILLNLFNVFSAGKKGEEKKPAAE